jgi:hypothetical protein
VPDPLAPELVEALASSAGGSALEEGDAGDAARAARDFLGSGPTTEGGRGERLIALAPFLALLSLLPLAFLIRAPAFRRAAPQE